MRYKEYNKNAVLEKAIRLFWRNGFNGCSINDLVEATGVNRFSLYHEFGSKEGILYASLELYRSRYSMPKFDLLNQDKGELQDILMQFYMSFLKEDNTMTGCYFIHVGTELADTDEQIRKSLNNYLIDIESLLKNVMIKKGLESEHVDRNARHLIGLFCTAMSFCLIHTPEQRWDYVTNGIHIILTDYATSITQ